ncbi:magnesium transporter [Shewanella sp. WXL01]|uniref:magnesium transporter n=1 Tax=Shewanella sp. WXL01 TaxID=2709721 RepID=UPI001FD878CE|nr:magnesium transporter [Shewanella sp. WXL01]
MGMIRQFFRVIVTIIVVLAKFSAFMAVMLLGAYLLAPLGTINSKDIDLTQFTNVPNNAMMMFFNSEYFSGYLFAVTIALVIFALYLLWQLHEVAVHKAEKKNSMHVQLVFALSLCGLFLHKAWWVMAIIIAFANWQQIGQSISRIIRNGLRTEEEDSKSGDKSESNKSAEYTQAQASDQVVSAANSVSEHSAFRAQQQVSFKVSGTAQVQGRKEVTS